MKVLTNKVGALLRSERWFILFLHREDRMKGWQSASENRLSLEPTM